MKPSFRLLKIRTILQGRGVGIFGALGSGNFDDKYCFTEINLNNYEPLKISAGLSHTGVITKDNKVLIFGRPYDINSVFKVYSLYRVIPFLAKWATKLTMLDENSANEVILSPTLIDELKNQKIKSISCSGGLTAMLSEDGKVYCMGSNVYGQCGLGDDRIRFWRPLASIGISDLISVDVGLQHGIALRNNGEVYCWGKGKNGQMGSPDTTLVNPHPRLVPIQARCIAIGAGLNHNVALDEFGELYIWGKRMSTTLVAHTEFTYEGKYYYLLFICTLLFPSSNPAIHKLLSSATTTVVKVEQQT